MGNVPQKHEFAFCKKDGTWILKVQERENLLGFRAGARTSKNFVDDADYFFYHFMRVLVLITNKDNISKDKINDPGATDDDQDILLYKQRRIIMINDFEYEDTSNYISDGQNEMLEQVKTICIQLLNVKSKANRSVMLREMLKFLNIDYTKYYYNYISNDKSTLNIEFAMGFDWHLSFFKIPHFRLYENEWQYLLKNNLKLEDTATTPILYPEGVHARTSFYVFLLLSNKLDEIN